MLLTNKLSSAKEKTPLMSSFLRMVTVAVVGDPSWAPRRAFVRVTRNVWGKGPGKGWIYAIMANVGRYIHEVLKPELMGNGCRNAYMHILRLLCMLTISYNHHL